MFFEKTKKVVWSLSFILCIKQNVLISHFFSFAFIRCLFQVVDGHSLIIKTMGKCRFQSVVLFRKKKKQEKETVFSRTHIYEHTYIHTCTLNYG